MGRSGRQGNLYRRRAYAGGKTAATTNRAYFLRKVVGHEQGEGRLGNLVFEVLECGHRMSPRSDMIGEYDACRRRCHQCPKPSEASG